MHDIDGYLQTLAEQAHPEGGWGYVPGQSAHPEPTCLALLALALQRDVFQKPINRGLAFLRQRATVDAVVPSLAERREAVWPTALVLFVQAQLGLSAEEIARTASRLLSLRGRTTDVPVEKQQAIFDIDFQLVGWSWLENTFSWVEPTAWACLALRRAGYGQHVRVQEGQRLLLDRAFDEGGINYGNRKVFDRLTEPLIVPTALLLLVFQGQQTHPRIAAAASWLRQEATQTNDLEQLCWAKLALEVYERATPPNGEEAFLHTLATRIVQTHVARAAVPWMRPSPLREALTALALAGLERNPFRLPAETASIAPPREVALPRPKGPSWGDRLQSAFQGLVAHAVANLRPVPPRAAVHIASVADYNADLADVLRRQFDAFRGQVPLLKGKRVVIKPNYIEYKPNKVINTHPHVVAAVIELCQREGAAEVVVAEGPGHWRHVEHIVQASGLGDVLRHYGVSFVDLNHDEPVKMANLGRTTGMRHLWIARTVQSAEVLISLAKLKTHHWAGATLSLKNLFGIMPGICYGWPKNELHWRGIHQSIVDIALTRTPDLAIVDGIIGMEGDGPLNGTPKALGVLVMGTDPLAVDATCCRLMRLDPHQIGYLQLGQARRLGVLQQDQIQQLGEAIEALAQPFATLPLFEALRLERTA